MATLRKMADLLYSAGEPMSGSGMNDTEAMAYARQHFFMAAIAWCGTGGGLIWMSLKASAYNWQRPDDNLLWSMHTRLSSTVKDGGMSETSSERHFCTITRSSISERSIQPSCF